MLLLLERVVEMLLMVVVVVVVVVVVGVLVLNGTSRARMYHKWLLLLLCVQKLTGAD